ncbi:MAG: group II intron reverse transcriptase/maturase [Deltaproteobacteria bacterium]|nr:MAG: group II intron reverse transcriptase/maturase [Deltaproteobacteria bacterium]
MKETSSSESVSTKLQGIAKLASEAPDMVFTTLAHHIDHEFLREAFRRTRKGGAPGVDGQTAKEYALELDDNLSRLLDRFKSGTYKAPPVRRVRIPKGHGRGTRPIGIPTFEDKVLQRAVVMLLSAVYEQDFRNCSYGFRPGRSAHNALWTLRERLMATGGAWVLEVDIQTFFDDLDPRHLRCFLDQRVRDGVLRRVIDKWLKAGVVEAGAWLRPDTGTPQGGVVSPVLSNVYLHHVVDHWFEETVKLHLEGRAFLVRYADDLVLGFTSERDARRVWAVLPKRFGKFGLKLHPEKTRLVPFQSPARAPRNQPLGVTPGAFDFLGFTHYWARSRKGYWVIKQKTAKNRFTRALGRVKKWCRTHRHQPVATQHRMLARKLKGHYQYYGVTGNWRALHRFRREVARVWKTWLDRRSQRARMPWAKYKRLLQRYALPPAVVIHSSYVTQRNRDLRSRMR